MNHLPPWSAERFETAKKLWMAGDSATMIAKHLNCGLTRSAVLGKIHRAGVASEGRATPAAPAARPAAAILAPASAPIPPRCTADLLQIETLDAHTCKWPIGDPKLEGFGFCGAHKPAETVYCAEHAPIAVEPQTPAKRAAAKKLYAYLAARA
jgi:GcrA cell cycle regulator